MRTVAWELCIALAAVVGVGAGYLLSEGSTTAGYPSNLADELAKLKPGPETDLIRYGRDLVEDTPRLIGRSALNPAMAYGGNDLSCQSCHLNSGLKPYAGPLSRRPRRFRCWWTTRPSRCPTASIRASGSA
ncbi:hypothetical protein [Methyloceanibacter methanicus]|uniref:hypothetical protein n=1 Tax=Methyloceanibacter methanicus TaxID=1774968 RepID=UPI00114D3858|nr:hypothetical protein [Methyloceanibacter methanicus]